MFDVIDGGVPTVFVDGPKKTQVGVVSTGRDGVPPQTLTFLTDLVYVRHQPTKVTARDANGNLQRYRGVAYRVDKGCGFMRRMEQEVAQAKADAAAGRVETL